MGSSMEERSIRAADAVPEFHRFREYLRVLALAALGPRLHRRFDASDVVQETLLQAHQKRDQLRGRDDAQVAAWLRQILKRTLARARRDHQRERRDARREVSIETLFDRSSARLEALLPADGSTPSSRMEREERALRCSELLAAIADSQREALVLTYLEGLSIEEAAKAMGRTPLAVASLVRRGLARLRDLAGETRERS